PYRVRPSFPTRRSSDLSIAESLSRSRTDRWLTAGRLNLRGPRGQQLELIGGALARSGEPPPEPIGSPAPRERADELAAIRSWIRDRKSTRLNSSHLGIS